LSRSLSSTVCFEFIPSVQHTSITGYSTIICIYTITSNYTPWVGNIYIAPSIIYPIYLPLMACVETHFWLRPRPLPRLLLLSERVLT